MEDIRSNRKLWAAGALVLVVVLVLVQRLCIPFGATKT